MTPRHGRNVSIVTNEACGGAGPTPKPLRTFCGRIWRRCWKLAGLAALVIGPTGAAFAYWNGSGIGTASAATGAMAAPSVVALVGGDAPSSALLPGGSSDVILRINNPNPYALVLTAISTNGSIVVSGASGTCTSSGVRPIFPRARTLRWQPARRSLTCQGPRS